MFRAELEQVVVGDVRDPKAFMSAVIDEAAFTKITGYQELAKREGEVLFGGTADRTKGWFVDPTFVRVDDPNAGWKGTGLWAANDTRAVWHGELGRESRGLVVKFQMRPDPLAH